MSKFLKRYNETTQKWELVSAPDVSVEQRLEDGSKITDTNVVISNENYIKEERETTLDDALTDISDDISRLQRNVSWLAEHGGGGGTGGGGSDQKSFGIEIISPTIIDGAAYVTGKTFEIEFMITGGSEGDECTYAYVYDSNQQTDYAPLKVNTSIKILIDNTESTLKEHSIIIRAVNPYGTNIMPKSFRIYESTLSLAFDTEAAGDDYKNGVFNIRQNSTYAYIPLQITNGLINSRTVVTAKYNENQKNIEFTNETTSPQSLLISLWDISKTVFVPGQYYVLNFNASATLGTNIIHSNEVQLRIRIVSPSEITIVLGVNGTSGEHVNIPLNSSIVYNFKTYVPALTPPVESTYYSAKIVNGDESYLILGKYYDEETKAEDANSYTDNDTVAVGTTVSSQYVLQSGRFNEGDNIELHVKVWSLTGERTATAMTEISVTEESTDVFPRQSNLRGTVGSTGNTIFLSWNKNNTSDVDKTKWTSEVHDYAFIDYDLSQSGSTVIADMNVLNANDASGIKTDEYGVPFLRLQNRAYAIANLSEYENEVKKMTADNSENYGFTISYTIMQDNYNDTKHTLLLWGKNSADGTLTDGIRIDADKAYWAINERTAAGNIKQTILSCPITSGIKTTVDFSYVRTVNGTTARIYLNGILNSAADLNILSPQYTFPNEIYFGANYKSGSIERYSDLNVYEFSVYTKSLNDLQIIVNGENARYVSLDEYKAWKTKNFISAKESDAKIPESIFFENGSYITDFDAQQINNIAARSNIPTMYLNFSDSAEFTSSYFYAKHVTSDTGRTFAGAATYYDPITQTTADNVSILVSLQGTSTLGYKIKNLEFYINESFVKDGQTYPKLFQPKKEWFPESQFTLKADVVDSAHANNAVLGEWINNAGVFDNNPAMNQFEANRPFDMDDSGNTSYGVDTDVTIKHTLEGFPILLFIKFSDKNTYTFLGIYSFNLGRYSYYNMGMKFLRGFSRRNGTTKVACPKIINYYEEMDNLGSISKNGIYSFELGNAGNGKIAAYPVWSQYRPSVIKTYGDFKYPSAVTDEIWGKLCGLFESIAKFRITSYYGDLYNKYDDIKLYEIVDGQYVTDGTIIPQQNESSAQIDSREGGYLYIKNAVAYFMIANAFGMTDSLGKNLTLRTWDGGNTWYCCFYDMDTALGLANDGSESNPITVCIDKVYMVSDPNTLISTLYTTYHDDDSKYAAVLSKIWGIFRDDRFLYLNNNVNERYEYIWGDLRRIGGKLSTSSNFTNIMEARVNSCGEMIYDYDYNTKYIQDTAEQESGSAAITFLHGTRVEYVKDWLRKHFYFLDGIFDVKRLGSSGSFSFDDSPYNSDVLTLVANYSSTIAVLPYTVQVSTPSFIGLSVGNDDFKKYYIAEENKDTVIYLVNGTSANSQLSIKGSTIITKLDGLQGGFLAIGTNPNGGEAKSLSIFDVSNSNALNENPINIDKTSGGIFGKDSSLEKINLSNTHGASTLQEYGVFLEYCDKVVDVDISNSDVTSLSLPNTALQSLRIFNSNIVNFTLRNQNTLTGISLNGCDKLATLEIDKCSNFIALDITDKQNLENVRISNCQNISAITIEDCHALTSVEISNNSGLKKLVIRGCENPMLDIRVYGSALQSIDLQNLSEMTNVITLPEKDKLSEVSSLTISNCYKISGIRYHGSPIETYNNENVFDFSPFINLNGNMLSLRNLQNLKYVRFPNDDGENPVAPILLNSNTFYGCTNLTKIFGYIEINGSNVFSNFKNFYINHEGYTPGDETSTPPFVYVSENPYYTNVKINATVLENCFSNTNCDISDVYYILQLCDENVLSLKGLFSNCENVRTTFESPLNEHMFSKCTNVENIDHILNGSCRINGIISENLLSPLILNLTSFDDVFSGEYGLTTTKCFFPVGNSIKRIVSFNPKAYDEEDLSETYHRDTWLLVNLTYLEEITNSFNDCKIDFHHGNKDATELFKYNTKLVKIDSSFRNIEGVGSIGNIFGGESIDEHLYPRNLSAVTSSFIFSGGYHDWEMFDGDTGEGILMPIGNRFLKSIANSIVYLTGNKPGQNETSGNFYGGSNSPSFCGPGILKYLDNFDYTIGGEAHYDDCNGEGFPYDIFKNCVKLKEAPSIFEEVHNFSGAEITINVPGRLFNDCINIENISKMFYNMYESIKCSLTSLGFKNCKLINVDYLFAKGSGDGKFNLTGQIPYGLFYQSVEKPYATVVGITAKQALELGISGESGNTEYPIEISTTFTGKYTEINKTIQKMNNVFTGTNSTSMTPYYAIINSWEDLVEDNPSYNPIMYFIDGTYYEMNPDYNPYKKVWNKYVYDNSVDFNNWISETNIENEVDDYGNPIIDMSKMPDEFKEGHTMQPQSARLNPENDFGVDREYANITPYDVTTIFAVTNYMFSPDIFRYCINATNVSVSYAFSNSSGEYNGGVIYGLRGTLPEFVFEPINKALSLVGVFESCSSIFPYYWRYVEDDVEYRGSMYPPGLFSGLINLFDITRLFSGGRIWGKTTIDAGLFSDCSSTLRYVSDLWKSSIWIDRGNETQLPQRIFNNCSKLTSVSGMLANSNNNCLRVITELLTPSFNPNLSDCDSFLYNATATTGNVPPFWEWSPYQLNSYHYALKGVPTDSSIIYNYTPERFDKFVRDN